MASAWYSIVIRCHDIRQVYVSESLSVWYFVSSCRLLCIIFGRASSRSGRLVEGASLAAGRDSEGG